MRPSVARKLIAKIPPADLVAMIEPARLEQLLAELADEQLLGLFEPMGEEAAAPPPASDGTVDDLRPEEDEKAQVYGALVGGLWQSVHNVADFLEAKPADVERVLEQLVVDGSVLRVPEYNFRSKTEGRAGPASYAKSDSCTLRAPSPPGPDDDARVIVELLRLADPIPVETATLSELCEWSPGRVVDALMACDSSEAHTVKTTPTSCTWAFGPKPDGAPAKRKTKQGTEPLTQAQRDAMIRVLPAFGKTVPQLAGESGLTEDIASRVLVSLTGKGLAAEGDTTELSYFITPAGREARDLLADWDEEEAAEPPALTGEALKQEEELFKALASEGPPHKVTRLAVLSGLPLNVIAASLTRLTKDGFVDQASGGFRITPKGEAYWKSTQGETPTKAAPLGPATGEPLAPIGPAHILELLKDGPKTIAQMASHLGVGVDMVRRPLEELVSATKVDRIGAGRWAKYASALHPVKAPEAKPKATRAKKGEQLTVPGA